MFFFHFFLFLFFKFIFMKGVIVLPCNLVVYNFFLPIKGCFLLGGGVSY